MESFHLAERTNKKTAGSYGTCSLDDQVSARAPITQHLIAHNPRAHTRAPSSHHHLYPYIHHFPNPSCAAHIGARAPRSAPLARFCPSPCTAVLLRPSPLSRWVHPCLHNSSPCAGPFMPYTRAYPTGAPAWRLLGASGPPAFSCFGCVGPGAIFATPPPSPRRHSRRHAAIAAVASPAIGAGACSPSARFHTRNATTASAALTPRAGYRTAALAPTSSSSARQRPRHHHYLSPFPSFSFARNSRARKQRVLVSRLALPRPSPAAVSASGTPLPPSSSPPSHALFAGGSSGCTRDPASASGAQPLPLAALRRSAAGCALAPHNSSSCAGPRAPHTRPDPAAALA